MIDSVLTYNRVTGFCVSLGEGPVGENGPVRHAVAGPTAEKQVLPMNETLLFNVHSHRIARVEKTSSRVKSVHTFGGTPEEHGYSISGSGRVHMLYRFDQTDELVPSVLPNCRYVPLLFGFYCCEIDSGDWLTAYRVISDSKIEVLSPKSPWSEAFAFYEGYPNSFPLMRAKLTKQRHDCSDIDDALRYSAVFGLHHLDPAAYHVTLDKVRPKHNALYEHGETDLELEEFLKQHSEPFMQGVPDDCCIWKDCNSYGTNDMQVIASVEGHPTPKAKLWSDTDDDPMSQIVYRQCMNCKTLYATDQTF